MKILVACEESGAVSSRLLLLGHDAWSCDVQETSGPRPDRHIVSDVLPLLQQQWDAVIAFPPCTHLASSGARWWPAKQADGRQQEAVDFVRAIWDCNAPRVAIENPVGILSTVWRKPSQIIQPWQYGHGEMKTTCLWLRGLPLLQPSMLVDGREQRIWRLPPSADRAKLRSKTYAGIADAMARQWFGKAQ